MHARYFSLLVILFFAGLFSCSSKKGFHNNVELIKDCVYDNQGRKTVEKLENVIANVSVEYDLVFLTVGENRYITCSIPLTITSKEIMISGNVLETFPTERLMAIPLQVTKAYHK